MRTYFIIFLISIVSYTYAQELNCTVTVNHDQVRGSDTQIFKSLEKSVNTFINNTQWTNKQYKKQERIECAITFNISDRPSPNTFRGTLQVQVNRPVFNSTYLSPIFNFKDEDLSFSYEEFQPLNYNDSLFESNLTSLLSFYANLIIAIDADTFSYKGGEEYYQEAQKIMLVAQQGNYKGWKRADGNKTRFQFIDSVLNNMFIDYRTTLYQYHLNGLDQMFDDKTKAKKNIGQAITNIQNIYKKRPNSFLLRVFLDTKQNEIVSIFSDGPQIDNRGLVDMLTRVYPARNNEWKKIK